MTVIRLDSDNLLEYATSVSNNDRAMGYAFAFGFVWAMLSDEQKAYIQRYLDSKKESH